MSSLAEVSSEPESEATLEGDGRDRPDSPTTDLKQTATAAAEFACTNILTTHPARSTPSELGTECRAGGGCATTAKLLPYACPTCPQLEADCTNTQPCELCSIPNKRYYLINIESPTSLQISELIISIDHQDLSRIQWLTTHFIEDIYRIYPPHSPKCSRLSIGIRDLAYPEGHFREISPSMCLSLLLREPYNPAVLSGNIYCHVPTFSKGPGGNSIKVLYKDVTPTPDRISTHSEYSTSSVSQTPSRTPPLFWVAEDSSLILSGTGPGQCMKGGHQGFPDTCNCVGMRQCTPITASPPQPIKPNYVAFITIQFMPSNPKEHIRVFRPPLELDVEQDGNFYTLQATVEGILRDANAVMGMGPLSDLVGRNAIFVCLAYNKFIIPGHFSWNRNSFAEFDQEHKGGTVKMHLTAWVLEHPLADPSGAPTGLPPEVMQSQSGRVDWVPYPTQRTFSGEEPHRSKYTWNREKGKERESDVSYAVEVQNGYTLPQVTSREYSGDSGELNKGYHRRGVLGDVMTVERGNEIPVSLYSKGNTSEEERAPPYLLQSWKGRVPSHASLPLEPGGEGTAEGSEQRYIAHNNSRSVVHSPDPYIRPCNQGVMEERACATIEGRLPRYNVPAGLAPKRRRRE